MLKIRRLGRQFLFPALRDPIVPHGISDSVWTGAPGGVVGPEWLLYPTGVWNCSVSGQKKR